MNIFATSPSLYPTPTSTAPGAPHVIKGADVQALDTRHVSDGDGRNTFLSIGFVPPVDPTQSRLDKRV